MLTTKADELAKEFAGQATTLQELNDTMRSLMKTALELMLNTEHDVHLGPTLQAENHQEIAAEETAPRTDTEPTGLQSLAIAAIVVAGIEDDAPAVAGKDLRVVDQMAGGAGRQHAFGGAGDGGKSGEHEQQDFHATAATGWAAGIASGPLRTRRRASISDGLHEVSGGAMKGSHSPRHDMAALMVANTEVGRPVSG